MYNFRNLDIVKNDEDFFIPAEAMYFSDSNLTLESLVNGYVTLQVTGRELAGPEVDLPELGYQDGGILVHRRFPTRKIVVTYGLFAEDDVDFRHSFKLLNQQLYTRDKFKFYFRDDPEYYWEGIVTEVGEFPAGTNQGKSTFTITCIDSFKRSVKPIEVTGTGHFAVGQNIIYPTLPDKFTFKYTGAVQNTYVQDGNGNEIFIEGQFDSGDELELIPNDPDKQFVYYFGSPNPQRLKVASHLKRFNIKRGSNVVVNANCTLVMEVSDKQL